MITFLKPRSLLKWRSETTSLLLKVQVWWGGAWSYGKPQEFGKQRKKQIKIYQILKYRICTKINECSLDLKAHLQVKMKLFEKWKYFVIMLWSKSPFCTSNECFWVVLWDSRSINHFNLIIFQQSDTFKQSRSRQNIGSDY